MDTKYFIITVDTECDNQWSDSYEQHTENAYYIPRFQELCEKYGFKPVYLIDYEMAKNVFLHDFLKKKKNESKCEIGMHMHAWSTPPYYTIRKKFNEKPFVYEYPYSIVEKKVKELKSLLDSNFGDGIVSHRAGRWMIDQKYISILNENGIYIDCSITPKIDWRSTKGSFSNGKNYFKYNSSAFYFRNTTLLEIPMTIERLRIVPKVNSSSKVLGILKKVYYLIFGKKIWVRLSSQTLEEVELAIQVAERKNNKYIEFMIHSSELMPGGSPYYKDEESINRLFDDLEQLFLYLKNKDYLGITLKEYKDTYDKNN